MLHFVFWLVCSLLGWRSSRAPHSASLRFTFCILLIFITVCGRWPKHAASGFDEVLQKKCCSCAAGCCFWCRGWRSRARMSWCVMTVVRTTHLTLVWSCVFVYLQVSCGGRDQVLRGRRQDERECHHLGHARPDCIYAVYRLMQ